MDVALDNHDGGRSISVVGGPGCLGAAVQNMYLMCTAHGGGSGRRPDSGALAQQALGHAEGVHGMGLFYMGYPEGEWPGKGHRKPLEYVTDWIEE